MMSNFMTGLEIRRNAAADEPAGRDLER